MTKPAFPRFRTLAISATGFALCTAPAFAHHGWAWTTGENIELTGTVTEADLGNPHGELKFDVDGEIWTIEVGQPWRNDRAGLTDEDYAPGSQLRIVGEPSSTEGERLLKAERVFIGETEHALYPDRD